MNLQQRISAFNSLGIFLKNSISASEMNADFARICSRAELQNPWFTRENIVLAVQRIVSILENDSLERWICQSSWLEKNKRIALVLQGKTPLDGFFDILGILLSGNVLMLKLAEKDKVLVQFILEKLIEIEPEFKGKMLVSSSFLPQFDAIIMENTNSQYATYFSKIPHVIRDSKTSIAVLNGTESEQDLQKLGTDIFHFFGQSEQNVTKIYIPICFDEKRILDALEQFNFVSMHYKYMNNYEYNKSIYLVAQQKHLDNGFMILKEDERLKSPLAVVYYERYDDLQTLKQQIETRAHEIYSVITNETFLFARTKSFGNAFESCLDDYDSLMRLQ